MHLPYSCTHLQQNGLQFILPAKTSLGWKNQNYCIDRMDSDCSAKVQVTAIEYQPQLRLRTPWGIQTRKCESPIPTWYFKYLPAKNKSKFNKLNSVYYPDNHHFSQNKHFRIYETILCPLSQTSATLYQCQDII